MDNGDVLVAVTTISFDIAGLEIYLPLLWGAQLVLITRAVAVDPAELYLRLNAFGVTIMQATPSMWRLLSDGYPIGPVLKILCGGEQLPPELAKDTVMPLLFTESLPEFWKETATPLLLAGGLLGAGR